MARVFIIFIFSLLLVNLAYALVDYTEHEFNAPEIQSSSKKVRKVTGRGSRRSSRSSRKSIISSFSFNGNYETLKVDISDQTKKVNKYSMNLNIQSTYNFFINMNHWFATSNSKIISKSDSTESGNSDIKLGFNWLKFGKKHDLITVDLYAGMMLKGDSEFASSRNDQIIGVETIKRFDQLAFGIGYEYRMVGDPQNKLESSVGNMNKFQVALGWRVSSDINLAVEGNYIKVRGSENGDTNSLLGKGFTFGYVTPKVSLGLGRFVSVDLGGVFRTKKVPVDITLLNARLWDISGLYGNSIFAGMNLIF